VGVEVRPPAAVSYRCGKLGRVDDVAEQNRCEDPLDLDATGDIPNVAKGLRRSGAG